MAEVCPECEEEADPEVCPDEVCPDEVEEDPDEEDPDEEDPEDAPSWVTEPVCEEPEADALLP